MNRNFEYVQYHSSEIMVMGESFILQAFIVLKMCIALSETKKRQLVQSCLSDTKLGKGTVTFA